LFADRSAIDIVELVALTVTPTRGDSGGEHSSKAADGGVVVFALLDEQPMVFGSECGVDLSGVFSSEEQRES